MNNKEYQWGRDLARLSIQSGLLPQDLWNQAEGSMHRDDFFKGWQDECEANGAEHPDVCLFKI